MRFELALLRARVLLRLQRPQDAIAAISACAFTPATTDALVSSQALLGFAYVRVGDAVRGMDLLNEAQARAREAHPTIRAELLLHRGIAHYLCGDREQAESLLMTVPTDADMISARALEWRGWIAIAGARYEHAARAFGASYAAIRACRWRDRFVEASVLQGLATLGAETMLLDGWAEIEEHIRGFDWDVDGLGVPRFWVALLCASVRELLGDVDGALAWSRLAEARAPNEASRATSLCRTASIFRGIGERRAHLEFADRARELYDTISARDVPGDHHALPLFIAEELAYAARAAQARDLLAAYRRRTAAGAPAVGGEDRHAGLVAAIEGLIAEAAEDRVTAVKCYSKSFRILRRGARRRAVEVALRLARVTGSARYVAYANAALASVHPDYWMAREARALHSGETPTLTDHQRTILLLVAQGKTYKEIASKLGRSWKTISNSVEHLRGKFGAATRGELVARALQHGVVGVGEPEGDAHSA